MSYRHFMVYRLVAIIAIAVLGAWAGSTGNLILLVPAAVILFVILFVLRKRVAEVVVDERVNAVAYRASRAAFLIFIFTAVIAGAALIYTAENSDDIRFMIGLTLDYSACALLVFYWLAFAYFNRKYGGKE